MDWLKLTGERLLDGKYPRPWDYVYTWSRGDIIVENTWFSFPETDAQVIINKNILEKLAIEVNHLIDFGLNSTDEVAKTMARKVIRDYGEFLVKHGMRKTKEHKFSTNCLAYGKQFIA